VLKLKTKMKITAISFSKIFLILVNNNTLVYYKLLLLRKKWII